MKRLDLKNVVISGIFVSKGSSWKFIIAYPFPIFLCHVIEIFVTFSESRWTDYSWTHFDNFLPQRRQVMGKAYILLAALVAFVLKSGIEAIPQNAQMPKLYFGRMI